jgi:hypothetical protein
MVNNEGFGGSVDAPSGFHIENSTISGNGAGIRITNGAYSRVVWSTIYNNAGVGILTTVDCDETLPECYVVINHNIVAQNGDNFQIVPFSPAFDDVRANLVDDDDHCSSEWGWPLCNTDPLLLPLADNGGSTLTHAFETGSPAIDAGGDEGIPCRSALFTTIPTDDQRGFARPQDGDEDGIARCDLGAFELVVPMIAIDIKPESFPNSVNPYNRGVIPVAILGGDTFHVADVDVTTLAFGPGGAPIAHLNGHLQDVNHDGIMDLMTHFRTQETGIVCGDESVTLTGETLDGQPFEGTDSIQTVGCRETRRPAIWMKDQDTLDTQRRNGPVDIERR